MKYCGVTREKWRVDRIKWIYPKIRVIKGIMSTVAKIAVLLQPKVASLIHIKI